jgi:energy-coupling factor transporter ATP-binding protein EcfA2
MIQNSIKTVIGHKGYGKTTLTELLAIMTDKPTIIADPRFQYKENDRRLFFKSPTHFIYFINNHYLDFKKAKLELVVNCTPDNFEELGKYVYKMKNVCFVIDEIDMFFDTRSTPKNIVNQLVQYGRHSQIDLITTSRRPANISRNLTALTDIFYFSKLREPNDKKYIKDSIGQEHVSTVENLNKFQFLEVNIEDENKKIINTTERHLKILS